MPSVKAAKFVNIAVVQWTDDEGLEHSQIAIVGDNNVNLLSGKVTGFGVSTKQGPASPMLRDAILKKLREE